MRPSVRAIVASASLALALTSHASRARADEPLRDRADAEILFDEGRKLLDDGKLDEACAKLEASNHLDPAVGTLLNLGECNERRGRLASAWSNYRAAASLALTRGDARAELARKRSGAVQPRLSTLTIVVGVTAPGLRVERDGVAVEEAAWGTALPIDPGVHVVEAQAPGKKHWTEKVVVPEGSPTSNRVKIAALFPDGSEAATPRAGTPAPSTSAGDNGRTTVRTLGAVGVGLGVVALGASVYFALHARSLWSDGAPHCDTSNRCDDVGFGLNGAARRNGDVATGTLVGGLVMVAAGTLAILFAPSKQAAPHAASTLSTGFALGNDGARFVF